MAHKNAITEWLLLNKQVFNPSFTEYDWPKRYCKNIFDFLVNIEHGGIKCEGRGISLDTELSIEKASAEAIERYICKKLNISSVGVAVSGAISSLEHAKNEALERYFLNQHLNLKEPLRNIDLKQTELNPNSFLNQFCRQNKNVSVQFYQMHTPSKYFGCICYIFSNKENISSFGFSLGNNANTCIEKSFLEALPNYAAKKDSLVKQQKNELNTSESTNLLPWHLTETFAEQIRPLLGEGSSKSITWPLRKDPKIEIEKINLDLFPEQKNCPIDPIRVTILELEVT